MHQFSRIVARNFAFGIGAQVAIKVLSFGFSILIVRNLGADTYGQYAGVLAFGAVFVFLGDLGLSGFVVREVARWRGARTESSAVPDLFANIMVLRLVLSVIAAVLLIATAWLTGRPLVMVVAIALGAIGLVMYAIQGTSDSLLAGYERLDLSAGARVLNQLAFVVVGAAALWLGLGYYGLIYANLLGIALMTWYCWKAARRLGVRPGQVRIGSWPAWLRAGIPFGVISFTLGLSYNLDTVVLNVSRGDVETGYYGAAYSLVFSALVFAGVLNTAIYPSLTRQVVSTPDLMLSVAKRALRYLIIVSLPIAVGASVAASQLVPFLYTAAYLPVVPALRIVVWVTPLMFMSDFLGYLVLIRGDEAYAARSVVVSTGANVILNVLLVPHYGYIAAAIMTVITEVVLVAQYVWTLRTLLRAVPWGRVLVRPLIAAAIMGIVVLALNDVPLLIDVAVGAVTYGGVLFGLGALGRDDIEFFTRLRRETATASGVPA